jgi:hypothetical protein
MIAAVAEGGKELKPTLEEQDTSTSVVESPENMIRGLAQKFCWLEKEQEFAAVDRLDDLAAADAAG